MSQRDQFLGQPMHHPLGAAIKLGWNSLRQRSYLRDAHLTFSLFAIMKTQPLLSGTGMPDMQRCRICEVPVAAITSWKRMCRCRDDAMTRAHALLQSGLLQTCAVAELLR